MSMFSRDKRRLSADLNTASLPDLIFTVLFFFMIVTNMKHDELKVNLRMPEGKQLEKLTNKSNTLYIYIGQTTRDRSDNGTESVCMQVNDRYVAIEELAGYVQDVRSRMSPEDQKNMKVSIKADRNAPMGFVNDVKQILRSSYVLDIVYSAETERQR